MKLMIRIPACATADRSPWQFGKVSGSVSKTFLIKLDQRFFNWLDIGGGAVAEAHLLLFNPKLLLRLSQNRKVYDLARGDLAAYLDGFLCLINQQAEAIFRQTSVLIECFPDRVIVAVAISLSIFSHSIIT